MQTRSLSIALFVLAASACTASTQSTPDGEQPPSDATSAPTETAAPTASGAAPTASAEPSATPPKMCTTMGCDNGVSVALKPAKEGQNPFVKGSYSVEVLAGGKVTKCTVSLPLPACDKGPAVKCDGDVKVIVGASGCALPPASHSFGPVILEEGPAEFEVIVKKDKKVLGQGKFKPTYKTVQPNGAGCEPTCNQAPEETIKLGG
ncbi:MAG: hypothetical protein HOW73_01935 [Polyangiaceae bacterium]|nr:hypothetical protein [Polyangiaceae bacterium]